MFKHILPPVPHQHFRSVPAILLQFGWKNERGLHVVANSFITLKNKLSYHHQPHCQSFSPSHRFLPPFCWSLILDCVSDTVAQVSVHCPPAVFWYCVSWKIFPSGLLKFLFLLYKYEWSTTVQSYAIWLIRTHWKKRTVIWVTSAACENTADEPWSDMSGTDRTHTSRHAHDCKCRRNGHM